MQRLFKYSFPVEGFGIIACILLMCSRYLGDLADSGKQALNHVLVVFILCVCVHFIRYTAAISHNHVWNDRLLSFLWCLPVFNLVITALQLMIGDNPVCFSRFSDGIDPVFSSHFFLPVFCICASSFMQKKSVFAVLYHSLELWLCLYDPPNCRQSAVPLIEFGGKNNKCCCFEGCFCKHCTFDWYISVVVNLFCCIICFSQKERIQLN